MYLPFVTAATILGLSSLLSPEHMHKDNCLLCYMPHLTGIGLQRAAVVLLSSTCSRAALFLLLGAIARCMQVYFMMHHAVTTFDPQYIMKADDDTYVNLPAVMRMLQHFPSDRAIYAGHQR